MSATQPDAAPRRVGRAGLADFADAVLRGSGQVIFMNSPWTGLLNLAAFCWGAWAGGTTWVVALGAVLGAGVATATAHGLGVDRGALRAGLYGFNGLLVGAALPTFLGATPGLWALLMLATAASTGVAWVLERGLQPHALPGLTFPFIVTTWLVLGVAQALPGLRLDALPVAALGVPEEPFGGLDFARAVGVSVAQVFFVDDAVAGAIFVLALALHSRAAAVLTCAGAAVGVALALGMGADRAAIAHGLWGYAAALTAPAVGCVFGRLSLTTVAAALLAAAATVAVQAAVFALAGVAGLPSLTIAFVLTTWVALWAHRRGDAPAHAA